MTYEWSAPGALLHVDVARLARFTRPGHASTGNRGRFTALGIGPPEAGMSDYAFAYRHSRALKTVLERHGARQTLTPACTPRWNSKVERFIQTLKKEWAYSHSWPCSAQRSGAQPSFLRYYSRRRPPQLSR